jgi:transposase-like protein
MRRCLLFPRRFSISLWGKGPLSVEELDELAVLPNGTRDVLGRWIEQTEGAKFWMKVFRDLKVRGCQDILIAVTDGLKGPRRVATKLIWLALRNITARWGGKAGNHWHLAMQQFAILFDARFTTPAS